MLNSYRVLPSGASLDTVGTSCLPAVAMRANRALSRVYPLRGKLMDCEGKPMDCEEYFLDATIFRIERVWSMGKGRQLPWHPPIASRCSVLSRCAGWLFRKFRVIRVKKKPRKVVIVSRRVGSISRSGAEEREGCCCRAHRPRPLHEMKPLCVEEKGDGYHPYNCWPTFDLIMN